MRNNKNDKNINIPQVNGIFNKTRAIYIALLALITAVVFSRCLSLGFVNWDDPANLLENKNLMAFGDTWSWEAVKGIFTSDLNGNYNPLPIFTFALEKHFVAPIPEEAPFIFHFDNLWMHIACTIMVFILFLRLGMDNAGAFIGALLFGIHPMRVESVAWVTERKDVLYGLFYMATLICYTSYTRAATHKKSWYAAVVALAILSYFSKVQAVTLPLSMLAVDYISGRKWHSARILLVEKAPFWLLSLAIGLTNIFFLMKGGQIAAAIRTATYTFIDKAAIGTYSYLVYIIRWIYPYKLSYYYDYPAHLPFYYYATIIITPAAVITCIVWAVRRQYRTIVFGLVFFTANIIFLLQVLPAGIAFLADRFTYIAYIGLFFITATGIGWLATRLPQYRKLITGITAGYCILLAAKTYSQTAVWQNTETLYESSINAYPDNYYGYNQLGAWQMKQAFAGSGGVLSNVTLLQPALANFVAANKADSIDGRPTPDISTDIMQNLGIIYGLTGNDGAALHYFTAAVQAVPGNIEAHKNRARYYFTHKQFTEAIAGYNAAIRLAPTDGNLYYLRANCYYSMGDMIHARQDIDKALTLKQDDPNIFIARSVINRAENRLEEARADAARAQALGANVPAEYLQ